VNEQEGIRRELKIPDSARIILYAGRLAKYKGCDILLEAIAPILQEKNLYILFVGTLDSTISGSEEMLIQMKQQIETQEWGERVKFLGYRKDIPRLMASADVLAHPTVMEGFGLTLVEALAVGLPVVASNVEGIPEVLMDTDSIMVPPNNPQEFRKAIIGTLNRSSEEVIQASRKGRKQAEKFRLSRRADMLVGLFESALSDRY
jgi:glycosyltransferase involved in cell wall biosynthesis